MSIYATDLTLFLMFISNITVYTLINIKSFLLVSYVLYIQWVYNPKFFLNTIVETVHCLIISITSVFGLCSIKMFKMDNNPNNINIIWLNFCHSFTTLEFPCSKNCQWRLSKGELNNIVNKDTDQTAPNHNLFEGKHFFFKFLVTPIQYKSYNAFHNYGKVF